MAARPRDDRSPDEPGAALVRVLVRVAQLETRVAQLETERRARHADPAADGRLLSAIAITFGERVFTAADLRRVAATEVRAALGAATSRTIGLWLRRLHRHPVPPYALRRVGRDEHGAWWMLAVYRAADIQPVDVD